ncbi:MAG: prefoldin subunit alpha [Candidatus Micrarchaeota archaeon]
MEQHSHSHSPEPQSNFREMEMQFNYVSTQIEEAKRQLGETRMALQEAQETLLAITELEKKPRNTIVSLGNNAFVPAQLENEKIIVPIGVNVLAQKTPKEALAIVEERVARISQVVGNIERALGQMFQLRQQLVEQLQAQSQ